MTPRLTKYGRQRMTLTEPHRQSCKMPRRAGRPSPRERERGIRLAVVAASRRQYLNSVRVGRLVRGAMQRDGLPMWTVAP